MRLTETMLDLCKYNLMEIVSTSQFTGTKQTSKPEYIYDIYPDSKPIWVSYGSHVGANMEPLWATHMDHTWGVQPEFVRVPCGHWE